MQNPSLVHRAISISLFLMAIGGLAAVLVGFAGDWNWFADLFSHLRPQYCIWLLITAATSLLLRRAVSAAVAVIGLAANTAALFPYARSWEQPNAAPVGRTWTVATINLLQGNREPNRVVEFLRDTHPDIVLFQEVSDRWARELASLWALFPYRYVHESKDQFGVALFSKEAPIDHTVSTMGLRESDYAISGTWISEGRKFAVMGIHPDKPDARWKIPNRAVYLENVAAWAEQRQRLGEAVIVIGDFNATPWSASARAFQRQTGFRNANAGRIFSASWNVWRPQQLLIDHAFLSSEWVLLRSEIGHNVGSDHRPLLVQAKLRSAAQGAPPATPKKM